MQKTIEQAKQLSAIQTRRGRTMSSRIRKFCQLTPCDAVTAFMSAHLRRSHGIMGDARVRQLSRSATEAPQPVLTQGFGMSKTTDVVNLVYSKGLQSQSSAEKMPETEASVTTQGLSFTLPQRKGVKRDSIRNNG